MLDAFDYQCHVAAFTARPHEQSDGTAARWMLGPHIPPQQGAHTVRLSASSDSILFVPSWSRDFAAAAFPVCKH